MTARTTQEAAMSTGTVPATTDGVAAAFRAARGEDTDADWARSALARLALDDVREPLARAAVAELAPVLAESGEPAADLFGPAVEWARDRQAEWAAAGVPATAPPGPTSLRAAVHDTLVGAAVVTVGFTVVEMAGEGWRIDLTVAFVLFPLLMSLGVVGVRAAWHAVVPRRGRGLGAAAAGGLLVAYAVAVAGAVLALDPVSLGTVPGVWMALVSAAYGLAASAVGRLWPQRPEDPDGEAPAAGPHVAEPPRPGLAAPSDDAWTNALRAALRERGDMTEARVRTVVAEAVAHARQTGRPLPEEFGSPGSYAARFARDPVVLSRRGAWSATLLALCPVALAVVYVVDDGWAWDSRYWTLVVWFVLAASLAVPAWWRALRVRRVPPEHAG